MRVLLLLCLIALAAAAAGCTITVKPIAQKKKPVAHSIRHHRRPIGREVEVERTAEVPIVEPYRNLKTPHGYKLMSPTPNPEYEFDTGRPR